MIFVVLGTQKFQFNRLLKEVDTIAEKSLIDDVFFAQIGNSDYLPRNYRYERFLDKDKFDEIIMKSEMLIVHSGVGTIISGLKAQKPIIVYPRLAKYKEHIDDHQLDIAKTFSEKNYVLMCNEEESLEEKIKMAQYHSFEPYQSNKRELVNVVHSFVEKYKL